MADSPKVADELFWLARAAEIIQESAQKLDEGAQRIASAMAWFWTVYSTAAAATFALTGPALSPATAVLAASPTLALFVAYALATWASLPVPIEFRVLEPYDVKAAHEKAIATKRTRVAMSLGSAAVATILTSVAVAAIALGGTRPASRIGIVASPTAGGVDVVVGGPGPTDGTVLVRVTPAAGAVESRVAAVTKAAAFAVTVPVPQAAAYEVEVSWDVDGRTTLLRESLKAP